MTDRERQLEGIAKAVYGYEPDYADKAAVEILAALRAEGFDIYRPDECEVLWGCETHRFQYVPDWPGKEPIRCGAGTDAWADNADAEPCLLGRYLLVPVGGEG